MATNQGKSNERPPHPPTWHAFRTSDVPAAEHRAGWAAISWRKARADLHRGLSLEFSVEPSRAVEFVAYARCRLGVPAGVRVFPKRRRVVLYPRPARHVAIGDRPPTRAILRAEYREQLRLDATIRTIVADVGTFLQSTPCGFDYEAALALFIQEHGEDYGIGIADVATLGAWIAAVESGGLLSPYRVQPQPSGKAFQSA